MITDKAFAAGVAISAGIVGLVAAVSGVYVLAGEGWALIAASVPCLAFAGVLLRGLMRG